MSSLVDSTKDSHLLTSFKEASFLMFREVIGSVSFSDTECQAPNSLSRP